VDDRDLVDQAPLSWKWTMGLLTDRYVVRQLIVVLVASVIALEAAVIVMSALFSNEIVILPPELLLLVTAIVGVLMLVAAGVVLGNRYDVTFTVDDRGVTMESGPRARRWNRIALWAGLLAGRPQLIGAGLLSQSRETTFVEWDDVARLVADPERRVVELRNNWRTVMRLYCPPELYGPALERALGAVSTVSRSRERRLAPMPPRRWGVAAAWIVAIVAAFVASLAWSWQPEASMKASFVATAFVGTGTLIAGAVGRLVGGAGALVAGLSLFLMATEAMSTFPRLGGSGAASTWELDSELLAISVVAVIFLAGLGLAVFRGRGAAIFFREREAVRRARGA
jgi:hypothetical protein